MQVHYNVFFLGSVAASFVTESGAFIVQVCGFIWFQVKMFEQ